MAEIILGSNVRAAQSDPSGPPGRTRGGVPGDQAREGRAAADKTAGNMTALPPYLQNPTADPLQDAFGEGNFGDVGPST